MSYSSSGGDLAGNGVRSTQSYHESLGTGEFGRSSHAASLSSDLESARPQTQGEEELQLQLALAMSKEEAEQVRYNSPLTNIL